MGPGRAFVAAVAAATTMMVVVVGVGGDLAADKNECMNTLASSLMNCLPYVKTPATAATPMPECCAGLKRVVQTDPKCLCVLVQDKDSPLVQTFNINITKAVGLPAACGSPANIAECPKLLNLDPNSKEAQVFKQYANQAGAEATAPSSSATGGSGSTTANKGAQKSAAAGKVGGSARAAVLSVAASLVMPFLLLLG